MQEKQNEKKDQKSKQINEIRYTLFLKFKKMTLET